MALLIYLQILISVPIPQLTDNAHLKVWQYEKQKHLLSPFLKLQTTTKQIATQSSLL